MDVSSSPHRGATGSWARASTCACDGRRTEPGSRLAPALYEDGGAAALGDCRAAGGGVRARLLDAANSEAAAGTARRRLQFSQVVRVAAAGAGADPARVADRAPSAADARAAAMAGVAREG